MTDVMTALLAFCGATILIAMVPGPSTVVVIRERIQHGRGPAMAALAGNETGILFWGLAAALGLSTLVAVSEVAYDTIRIAGVVVLVCLGVQALRRARRMRRETVAPTESKELPARSAWAAYRTGVVT